MKEEEMTEEYIEQLKSALQKCEKENENRATYTCEVIVSLVCKDARNCIAELEKELKRVKEDNKLLEIRGSDLLKELLDKNKKCKQLEKEKEETRKKVIEIFANDEMQQGELWKACGLRLVGWDYEKNQLDEQFMTLYGVSN